MKEQKKIILYNTHLKGLINYGNLQIKKMRSVFEFFKEHDELVLWWRPHPLSKSTLKSMNPQLLEEYIQLEDTYKKENIGILDDTPDVDRAILYSNGYYGDTSSLVTLCSAAGKPVLVQNVIASEKTGLPRMRYCKAVKMGGKLYVCSSDINAIFSIDLEKGRYKLERWLSKKEPFGQGYELAAGVDGQLFLLSHKMGNMLIYDVKRDVIKKIRMDIPEGVAFHNSVVLNKDSIFFLPYTGTCILKYNMHEEKIFYIDNWNIPDDRAICSYEEKLCFMHANGKKGNCFYAASACENQVLEYEMDSGKIRMLSIENSSQGFSDLLWDGEKFWLATKAGELLTWDGSGCTEKIKISIEGLCTYGPYPFMKLLLCDKWIYVFPRYANMVFRIHRKTFETEKVYQIEKDTCIFKFNIAGPICYCADRISQDNILALFPIEDCLIIIDGKNGAVKKYYLQVEKTDADEIKGLAVGKYVFGENTIGTGQNAVSVFQEKWPQTLEAFAEYLCADRNRMIEQEENTGEQIYRYIKGELSENA